MYRDDPLDDEFELRALVGDAPVDRLAAAQVGRDAVEAALDILRVLQGWVDDDDAAGWFQQVQKRLDGRTPLEALATGAFEEVEDAARAWVAARS